MSEIFGNEQTIQNLDKASNSLDSLQTKLLITQYSTAALDVVAKKFSSGSLNNIVTGFNALKVKVDDFNKSGDKVNNIFKTFTKTADVLNKSVEKSDSLFSKVSKSAAKFGESLDAISTGVFAIKGFNIIADGFAKINNEVNKLNASLAILNKSGIDTSNLIALQSFTDSLTNLDGKNIEDYATTFVAMYKQTTTLMSQIATQTTDQIEAYNKSVEKSVDKGKTYLEKYFDDMQDMVNDKLKNTVTSTDALRASYTGLQAGLKPGVELTNAVANSLKLMTTQGGDADQIMTLLVQTMTAYNMSASESGKIMAKLNELVNVGITDVPQLQMGFGQLAVVASSTNVNLDEMSGSLAALTLNGYSTARSFTALQNLFNQISSGDITQRLIANGSKYIENGKLVQATLDANTIATKGFAKALEDVNKSMGGNKAKWQEIIPDMEAYGAAIALTGEKAKTLKDSIDRIANVSAANLEKAFNIKINEDQILNFSRLVNRTSELLIRLGKLLAPLFDSGLSHLEKLTTYSEKMMKNYSGIISVVVQLTLQFKLMTSVIGVLMGKILALGGAIVAWRISTGAIFGDLKTLFFAITNNSKALGGYNLLWDANVSGMKKASAVIGQILGLHSLEASAISNLSIIESKRLSQDIKDSALRMRNDKDEIKALDAKIARYETLKRINAENYDSPAEKTFALGEIAKNKQTRLNDLLENYTQDDETIFNYGKNRNQLKRDKNGKIVEIENSKILSDKQKKEKVKEIEEAYIEKVNNLKLERDKATRRRDEIKAIQNEYGLIEKQLIEQRKLENISEKFTITKERYKNRIKYYEEKIKKETDEIKIAKYRNRIDNLQDLFTKQEQIVMDFRAGKDAFGALSQQEIYQGERAIGIKNAIERGSNKYFWDPEQQIRNFFSRDKKKAVETSAEVAETVAQSGKVVGIIKSATQAVATFSSVLGRAFVAAGGVYTLMAAGMFTIINDLDSYSRKVKDVGANLSHPVKLMSTWETIGNNLVTSFTRLRNVIVDITKELSKPVSSFWEQTIGKLKKNVGEDNYDRVTKSISENILEYGSFLPGISQLKALTDIKKGIDSGRERITSAKLDMLDPVFKSVNTTNEANENYRNKTLNQFVNQYSYGRFNSENISDDPTKVRKTSVNELVKKALSGQKFELNDSQDFGSVISKLNSKAFELKTETTKRLNDAIKDKEGIATLIDSDSYVKYLDALSTRKPKSAEELKNETKIEREQRLLDDKAFEAQQKSAIEEFSKMSEAQKANADVYFKLTKQVNNYSEKLELLTKQTKLWADALQSVSGYLNNLAKSGGEQFSAGKGLQNVIKESENKLEETSKSFHKFLKELANGDDLSKISSEELTKRLESFGEEKLKQAKDFRTSMDANLTQFMQTSQTMLESGFTNAQKELERFDRVIKNNLTLGVIDPASLNEVLKTRNALQQQTYEDDLNWVQKEKDLYLNMYEEKYKKYFENTQKIRKLDVETAQLEIDKAKSALEIINKDKSKDENLRRNAQKDLEIAVEKKRILELKHYDEINKLKENAFNIELNRIDKEKSIYSNLYDYRYTQFYEFNEKIRKLELKNSEIQVIKAKQDLQNALNSPEKYNEYTVNDLRHNVDLAVSNREKLKRDQDSQRLNDYLKQIELKYQNHHFNLLNLQLKGSDESQKLIENEYNKNQESLKIQLSKMLDIQRSSNSIELQKEIEETKFKIVQNVANKIIAEYERVDKKRNLEQTKILNSLSLKNPELQTNLNVLEKQLDILEKQKSILDQQNDKKINDLEQFKNNVKNYATQKNLEKEIIRQKEIALQRQIESEGITLKIQKEQRDLKLEMLKIDQDMEENRQNVAINNSASQLRKTQIDYRTGDKGVTLTDVEMAKEDLRLQVENLKLIRNKRIFIAAQTEENKYLDKLDSYNSRQNILSQQDDLNRRKAASTLSPVDDYELNRDIANREPEPIPTYNTTLFSQQSLNVSSKQLNILEKILGVLSDNKGDNLPHFADGGVVRRKTKAIIGESGTEAVIPMPDGKTIPVIIKNGNKETWNGFNVKTIEGHKVLDTKNTKAIEAYKKWTRDNDREFENWTLPQIENYWVEKGFITKESLDDPKFLSSKTKPKRKSNKTVEKNWLGYFLPDWLSKFIYPKQAYGANLPLGEEDRNEILNPITNKTKKETDIQKTIFENEKDRKDLEEMRKTMSNSIEKYNSPKNRKSYAEKFLSGILKQQGLTGNLDDAKQLIDILNSGKAGKEFDLRVGNEIISQQRFENFIKTGVYGKPIEKSSNINAATTTVKKSKDLPVENKSTDESDSNIINSQIKALQENTKAIEKNTTTIGENVTPNKAKIPNLNVNDWEKSIYKILSDAAHINVPTVKSSKISPPLTSNPPTVLQQLQNDKLNKEFFNRVVENIKSGKGGFATSGDLSDLDIFTLNLADKQKNSKHLKDFVEKNRKSVNTITPLSKSENKTSNNVNVTINVKVDQGKDSKSTGQNIADSIRNELYDIFNDVKFRMT